MVKTPAFLPSSLFSHLERNTEVLYDIRKLKHFAVLFVYIDKEQLDKLSLVACGNKLAEGSEKTYYGTVTDRAMSVVNEGDRQGRAYISITTGNEDIQFWLTKDYETNAKIGDKVIIESAIEEQTNLLVATSIRVE